MLIHPLDTQGTQPFGYVEVERLLGVNTYTKAEITDILRKAKWKMSDIRKEILSMAIPDCELESRLVKLQQD